MDRAIAYVANGVLHLRPAAGPARAFESPFAGEMRERAHQIHRRHAWKTEGRGAMFMSRGLLWGPSAADPETLQVAVTCVSRAHRSGEVLYALTAERRTAVCRLRVEDGVERRLLHGSELRLDELIAAPGREEIACTVVHGDGTSSLAVMSSEATDLVEVTEGEVRDGSPFWMPGAGRRLCYASAGVGRDGQGRPAGLGASSIRVLDLDSGAAEEVACDPRRDLLMPRAAADGTLYYVSRPRHARERPAAWRAAIDVLMLPLRLLYAVFQYLSFFVARYTGRPLTTAGGPERRGADARQMQVWSNLLEAQQAAREDEDAVPKALRASLLLRRRPDGRVETAATGVLSYDLDPDSGAVVYSTGNAVFLLDPSGTPQKLVSTSLISKVVFID
ncbi:MAG TPA: hypothetical protein VMX54_19790 [Vicinamibacteria bacterium]|nr:hypothetical protein [Vicinamibacteria bacterium]